MTSVIRRRHGQALRLSLPKPQITHSSHSFPNQTRMPSLISSPSSHGIRSLSDLEKVAVLGHGNGGIGYRVHHKKSNSFYALKILNFDQDGIAFHQPPTFEAEILKRSLILLIL
ncbi:putative mitogen-activated protein kinase kinase [Medicago truncatula]|uniref:Putative mitogen-activated protein kinase kinase n=1 Tax=Medicago truncatula TaxID=3880 RepID=A0A396HVT4_MEDTR|nr:putative mitogen-activated protein kinase kinase [Medicago truncatula]